MHLLDPVSNELCLSRNKVNAMVALNLAVGMDENQIPPPCPKRIGHVTGPSVLGLGEDQIRWLEGDLLALPLVFG
ncbi:hypothetical protein CEXT_109821 [Caerostris extrusa]|uniref:Uncharacterized protein n=1 Tax=Caerostris extrusa TaxID=172846 RepID=A0AAV4U7P9_CAEEX|nr:hypothetical protein CEXT_109821 [Caerostris extrusa]